MAANGTPIEVYGEKTIDFEVNNGRSCAMKYLITGVKKPLAAVSAIVDGGSRVVFDSESSYIENKVTGERIGLKRKDGAFMMEMNVHTKKEESEGAYMDTSAVEEGFRRPGW